MLSSFNRLFPLWAILVSALAFVQPVPFSGLQEWIVPLLAAVMFMMGLTLTGDDFRRVLLMPRPIFIGVALQFLIMPLVAFVLAGILQLSPQLTAGMVLVGSCAGGTASNVICFLARGDVALSISMTLVSTLLGVFVTPLLCTLYLATTVTVDTLGMLLDIVQVVLVPVLGGLLANRLLGKSVARLEFLLPTLSVLIILLIIAVIVALNAGRLAEVGPLVLIAVILHNSLGLTAGFYLSRLLGLNLQQSRTIAIEVGMQNSGLGVALALEYFSATAALPAALFSIWHNISGSLLATRWSSRSATIEAGLDNEQSKRLW
ncbi:MAG: bile acid:sodium symporter family protein [Pseudomonadales bacterium]|nr:bile acid:sodium symporter family protein [Pseudomonadales bacterium]MCP5346724.1 bile acid:sodium symporter family protein [Pseudomonadales bacterium]